MSKKKAASTMSLKDFHGGSIPSDLPLPSAPGLTVKDRNASTNWSSNSMRPDLRPRPKSSGAARGFDEKASFLSHLAPIGRNFDEDERKPLDALSAPRRTINDENVRAVHQPGYVSSIRVPDRPVSSPVPQSPLSPLRAGRGSAVVSSQNAGGWVVSNSSIPSGSSGQGLSSNPPNAWGLRRDVAGATEENGASHTVDVGRERGDYDTAMGSQAESGWVTGDRNQGGGKTLRNYRRDQSRMNSEEVPTGGAVGSQTRPVMPPEVSDRPKLNLLSKTKPLVRPENDYRQGHRQPIVYGKIEVAHELYGNENSSKPGLVDAKSGSQSAERPVERPKLNLKPRTQPLEKSDGILEIERAREPQSSLPPSLCQSKEVAWPWSTLFGNARPRELVLKERGVDDLAFNKLDLNHSPNRMNSPKIETTSEHVAPTAHQSQKIENRGAINRRNGRDSERKDQRTNHEKTDLERKNWRNDKWKSRKDSEEQWPEPETWRKPIEESKPASSDAAGNRPGKILSALGASSGILKVSLRSKDSEYTFFSKRHAWPQ
ncbi:hypothetical protein OIU77_002282 [Salix suchowensis]|uniref:Uncharacterized protein n=1 Tax=Salix suchowensis TaxID=1278906 RepID=A0ABQ9B4E0_9ROSI|nr:hypothetical protein OIU77_002282 [Salix suchowensis]